MQIYLRMLWSKPNRLELEEMLLLSSVVIVSSEKFPLTWRWVDNDQIFCIRLSVSFRLRVFHHFVPSSWPGLEDGYKKPAVSHCVDWTSVTAGSLASQNDSWKPIHKLLTHTNTHSCFLSCCWKQNYLNEGHGLMLLNASVFMMMQCSHCGWKVKSEVCQRWVFV